MANNDSILLDIGANFGGFSLEMSRRNPTTRVIAIEAEPELAARLRHEATTRGFNNHSVAEFAVSDTNGTAEFHVSHQGDWGTSSLLTFDAEHLKSDPYWSTRPDLMHDATITVPTQRMDSFLDTVEYRDITFVKIDVQGLDLVALKSFGAHLSRVKAGMLEVVGISKAALYVGEIYDLRAALNLLAEHNFVVYKIQANDPGTKEFNLFFHRHDVDIRALEAQYHLNELSFYDGRDFWCYPSNKFEDVDGLVRGLRHEIATIEHERDTWRDQYRRLRMHPVMRILSRFGLAKG